MSYAASFAKEIVADPAIPNPTSFVPQARSTPREDYVGNGLRFATAEEAQRWADGLMMRWFGCDSVRVAPSTDPVSHRFNVEKGDAEPIEN
jgi:hypothetical protein